MRYTTFQQRVLRAVADCNDPTSEDIKREVGTILQNAQRTLHILYDRGLITGPMPRGPWHVTAAGQRLLSAWDSA